MATTIKLRNGTAAAWTSANPTLAAGEAGLESDTGKLKFGNGSTAWNSLAYFAPGGGPTGGAGGDLTGTYPNPTIAANAVTYAKLQDVSATDKLLGRASSGAGDVEEIACTAAGRALLDDADATAQRATLGLGTLATQSGTFSGTSSGTNTGDQTITLTGDVTGSGTGSFAATLANTAVTPGSYTKANITVDSKGRVTAAADGGGTVVTGRAVLSATQGITGSASYQDVTDLSLTLPGAGTYLVTAHLYNSINASGSTGARMYARLVLNGTAVANSEFVINQCGSGITANVDTTDLAMVVTAAGAHVLKVQVARAVTSGSFTLSNVNASSEGGSYLEYVQLESTGGGSGGSGQPVNLLVNGDFRRTPQQARATLTGYATAASGTSADQFATNWGVQHNATGSTVQMRNWSVGDGSPPVSFSELGPSYLQLKNNDASARGVMIYQYLEANGPDGLAAVAYRARQVAASVRAVASTGTPTLKCTVIEWTGTADAPARPVASWASNVPSLAAGWGALGGYAGSGTAVLNTSTAVQADISGTPTSAANGLMLCVWVEGLAAGASLYLSSAWLGLGGSSPAWAPHPSDEDLCLRYCETSYTPGSAPGTASTSAGASVAATPSSVANGAVYGGTRYAVPKRATPSVTVYNYAGTAGSVSDFGNTDRGAGTVGTSNPNGFSVSNGSGSSQSPGSGGVLWNWIASARINPT